MSFELDYLPPKCGKYKWHHKTMNYSCWGCRVSEQLREGRLPDTRDIDPLSITCNVDISEGRYWWRVTATDWEYRQSETKGWADTAEEAICKAEEIGERYWDQLVKDWMVEALQNRWRPPSVPVTTVGSPTRTFELSAPEKSLLELQQEVECWCQECCMKQTGFHHLFHMVLCPECGNKRCPKASNHEIACTGSNEPGQEGSVYS